jgi:hypothetical protein
MSKSIESPISISSHMSKNDPLFHLQGLKYLAEELLEENPAVIFDPQCIRKKCNWSSVRNEHKFDDISFQPEFFLKDIPNNSPKLDALLKKIAALDARDEKKYGKKFKHFIFSDIKSGGQGAKMLASALIAKDWTLGYRAELKNRDKVEKANAENVKTPKALWGPLELLPNDKLAKNHSFYLLSSVSVFDKPISVKMKKEILARFNERPANVYGENIRIIIMDSGFKEGIDLFDIKYIHIFEPSVNSADQKQVIGRGTRTCGQKGLEFHPSRGWPLEVYVYDLEIPEPLRTSLLGSENAQELLMKAMNMDVRLANFEYDIERLSIIGSVDYELNKNVHEFKVDLEDDEEEMMASPKDSAFSGGAHLKYGEKKGDRLARHSGSFGHKEMKKYVEDNFKQHRWQDVKMENLCQENTTGGGKPTILKYTPTQAFIRDYFKPSVPVKGMLLYHTVGTGKTCSAIAAATNNFEPEGYTILWVTRTTLKNDIWKNMFDQVCNESIRSRIENGEPIPEDPKERMKLLSKAWRIRPISYKQFSNLVSKQNAYYQRLVKENGEADPLRKTLLIIDEAHKLYGGGDLSSLERPDMEALHKSLMISYEVSGKDSARLLLMTATPITENPMELIRLMNLCKPIENQLPSTFELFSKDYLNEDGKFSEKGQQQYLDDIAGHISYLNREKDARQFSQPIIKRVMVPIITEEQMKDVRDFDKYIAKTDFDAELLKLNKESEKVAEKLDGELAEMDKSRFQHLKEACEYHEEIPKKKCEKIVNRNIQSLMQEVKTHVKTIKEESKKIKSDIKKSRTNRHDRLRIIQDRILKHPELFAKYKSSTYAALRTACSSTIRTSAQFLDAVKDIPEVLELNRNIQMKKEEIESLKNEADLESILFKRKIKNVKDMLRNSELSELERSVLELTLRSYSADFRKTSKRRQSNLSETIEGLQKEIKATESDKNKVFTKIKTTLKKTTNDRKRAEKESKRELRNLRKTLRKQGKIKDEIVSDEIQKLVEKREVLIERDLENASEEIREKEIEKLRKQQEKAEQREEKAKIKAAEKNRREQEKRQEKERLALEKKREKEAEKTRKKQEKLEQRALAALEKKTRKNQKV